MPFWIITQLAYMHVMSI